MARAATELDNVRAALSWAEQRAPRLYARTVAPLWFFFADLHPREARRYFDRALAHVSEGDDRLRALLLNGSAFLAWKTGDPETATAVPEEAVEAAEACGDVRAAGCALTTLGSLERDCGRFAEARRLHERAARTFEAAGDAWGVARSTYSLGYVAYREGSFALSRELLERSVEQSEQLADNYGVVISLAALASLAIASGELDRGEALVDTLARAVVELGAGEQEMPSMLKYQLGRLRARLGDHALAARLLRESVAGLGQMSSTALLSLLAELGVEEWALGRTEAAAIVLGAAAGLTSSFGYSLPAEVQEQFERTAALVREADGLLSTAWERGSAMTLDEAVAFVLADTA